MFVSWLLRPRGGVVDIVRRRTSSEVVRCDHALVLVLGVVMRDFEREYFRSLNYVVIARAVRFDCVKNLLNAATRTVINLRLAYRI